MCNILNNCDADFKAYLDSGLWSILESCLPLDFWSIRCNKCYQSGYNYTHIPPAEKKERASYVDKK